MVAVTIWSDFGAQENTIYHSFHFEPFYLPWSDQVWVTINTTTPQMCPAYTAEASIPCSNLPPHNTALFTLPGLCWLGNPLSTVPHFIRALSPPSRHCIAPSPTAMRSRIYFPFCLFFCLLASPHALCNPCSLSSNWNPALDRKSMES